MDSSTILYIIALLLQVGATYYFADMARKLGMRRLNPFTIAFGLIVIRRVAFLVLTYFLPAHKNMLNYIDTAIMPLIFSVLLFVGTFQLHNKLTKIIWHKNSLQHRKSTIE